MDKKYATSWIEIDKEALHRNIAHYKRILPVKTRLSVVIKSNAYGHGIALIGKLLDTHENVDLLCVVSLSEALFLRSQGITKPLLVLSIIDGSLKEALEHDIELIVYSYETAVLINQAAQSLNKSKKARIHIKIDTGLSRLGVLVSEAEDMIMRIAKLEHIVIEALFSHLANSEEDAVFAQGQIEKLISLEKSLAQKDIRIAQTHVSCSAALTSLSQTHMPLVRLGIGVYGLWPSEKNKHLTQKAYPEFELTPVLTWKTRIIQIKTIKAGSSIGYGRTHTVTRDTRIAIVPVGYWDGYDRGLSNKAFVTINGQAAPVVGRIAMNMMVIDVTDLNFSDSDEVVLLGGTGITSADTLAQICHTINYEIVTRINPLLLRVLDEK